jgi:hypothetical protein
LFWQLALPAMGSRARTGAGVDVGEQENSIIRRETKVITIEGRITFLLRFLDAMNPSPVALRPPDLAEFDESHGARARAGFPKFISSSTP